MVELSDRNDLFNLNNSMINLGCGDLNTTKIIMVFQDWYLLVIL